MVRLRTAILGRAILIMIGLAVVAFAQPDLFRPLMFVMFAVLAIALLTAFFVERRVKRRDR